MKVPKTPDGIFRKNSFLKMQYKVPCGRLSKAPGGVDPPTSSLIGISNLEGSFDCYMIKLKNICFGL